MTRCSVLAGVALALIDVHLAGHAGVSRWALALISIDFVDAGGVIFAGYRGALIDVDVAVIAGVPGLAETLVGSRLVHANAIHAQGFSGDFALVYVLVTEFT